ncbi:hypothetical protein Tco_0930538 [Tanacetum coccineum]
MYLTASRPDIIFAVYACSRFQVTPKTSHLNDVKRIFRYLKGKPKLGLWCPRVSLFDLEAYSDSDYARANIDRKSTIGGCQFLGRRLISWQCKKQTIVAISTIEAKYVAAANCCRQVLWIQNQMLDYGFNFMNTKIYIDNESTICIVENPVFHSKTKHIKIRHHFIRDAYKKKLIQVLKIHTNDNVADLLTKAFDVSRHQELASLEQTASGKDFSNPLIVDSLLKTIWLSMHHVIAIKHWLFQGKRQLETAALCTMEDGVPGISATIDRKVKVLVFEASIRSHLKLEDSEGLSSLPNAEIFEQLTNMGYVTDSDSLTFQKGQFSLQWDQFSCNLATAIICLATNRIFNFSKFLFETIVKNIDSQHKFLMYPRFIQIFVNKHQRLLLPHKTIYPTPTITHKLFNNMKRVSKGYFRVVTPLFDTMIAQGQSQSSTPQTSPSRITSSPSLSPQSNQPSPSPHLIDTTHHTEEPTQMPHESPLYSVHSLGRDEGSLSLNELTVLYTSLSEKVASLESELKQTNETYSTALTKLILRVKKLEKKVQTTNSRRKTRIVLSEDEDATEDPSNQGRIIEEIDADTYITLVTPIKVSSQSDQSEDHLRVLSAAKVLIEAAKQGTSVGLTQTYTRRRRNVGTGSGGVSTASKSDSTAGGKAKDKGKEIMQEPEPPKKLKKRVQVHMSMDEEISKKMFE